MVPGFTASAETPSRSPPPLFPAAAGAILGRLHRPAESLWLPVCRSHDSWIPHLHFFSWFMLSFCWGTGNKISETACEKFNAIHLPDLWCVTSFSCQGSELPCRTDVVSGGPLIGTLASCRAKTLASVASVIIISPPVSLSGSPRSAM